MIGAAAILVVGCAAAPLTEYKKSNPVWGSPYGYSDKQIGPDELSITVRGSPKTSKDTVAEIALLRAAHMTKDSGRTHFLKIGGGVTELAVSQMISIPIPVPAIVFVPVAETPTKEPIAVLAIRMLEKGSSPSKDAIDAQEVIEKLSPTYE